MMTYDGRYRLGCEGMLYILLEPFQPSKACLTSFQDYIKKRKPFEIIAFYDRSEGNTVGIGSSFCFDTEQIFTCSNSVVLDKSLPPFRQKVAPCFQLIIIGAEHDAVQLCLIAYFNGWEVTVVSSIKDPKTITDFPGAQKVIACEPNEFNTLLIDNQTAVVLMTHNFAKDFNFLTVLSELSLEYVGLLGPVKRREQIIEQLLDRQPDLEPDFLDRLYGPSGLNIGAETPQEIATSIVAEILSVTRKTIPKSLSSSNGVIHVQLEKNISI
jgi:xanthine/CO dehydrogenase XdhC/CoxF family maturation factor